MKFFAAIVLGLILTSAAGVSAAEVGQREYIGDVRDRLISVEQGWGELGIDGCAHAPGQIPMPLRIKDTKYDRGLGHHAPGEIVVDLNGEYSRFEAKVGVQWQSGDGGTVVFQVFVDDVKRFDSGVMRERDQAKAVSIAVSGTRELRLVTGDSGDGINCDCADWADAFLIRATPPKPRASAEMLDIAPFARVITSDANRSDGVRAGRTQEIRADELFLDTDVKAGNDGAYAVPSGPNGQGSIGLRWLERRSLKELRLQFANGSHIPLPEDIRVQYWTGESAYQGAWQPLKGKVEAEGRNWVLHVDGGAIGPGTWKVRWIFPKSMQPVRLASLPVFSPARVGKTELSIQLEKPARGTGLVEIYNGEIVAPAGATHSFRWNLSEPLRLKLRYAKSKYAKSDRTVLMLRLPQGSFSVEVDDVLANGCVYVKDRGVFVTRVPDGPTIAAYKKQIAGRQTVLERVRKMPDQTYTQAMAKTHHKAQDNGPVMLSLACDNNKFVVQREGSVQYADIVGVSPRFGSAGNNGLTRHMDGGWLPAPVVTVTDGGIVYSERAFVAPFGKDGRSLGVIEYTIKNPGASSADVSLALAFPGDSTELSAVSNGIICRRSGRLLAWTDTSSVDGLRADAQSGAVKITGTLGAGEKALCSVYIPTWEMKPQDCALIGGNTNLFASFEAYWKDVMAPAMQVELPDKHVSDAIRASQVHCLIAARNEGDGKLIAPWIASMAYGPLESESNSIILGMDLMGHSDFARKSLDYFIHNYNPSGYLTTGYTVMGTGWHLWSVGEHYRLTRDAKWVKSVAPEVDRVCQWVTKQTEKTRRLDVQGNKVPEYGLMPPGVMADWNVYAYYNCLNGYFYAGLEGAGRALADTGYPGSQSLLASAAELRGNILRGYRWTQARTPVLPLQDGTWVPGYPSQLYVPAPTGDFFPGEDGNRSWCYDVEVGAHHLVPLGVMDANSPETAEMLDHMEDVQFLSDGWFDYPGKDSVKDWFNLGGFSKVQPYYSRNAEIYAMRDDVKPFVRSYFNAMASLLNTENLSFWEHFSSNGAWNKTHETGYFLQQSRFMLVDERGDDLWLAPFVTNNWMKDGMAVAARNAPTAFGPVSYRIKSSVKSGYIEAVIDPPTRTSPKMIVIRLRHPEGKRMKSVTVNGRRYADFDPVKECVRLKPTGATMTVRARY